MEYRNILWWEGYFSRSAEPSHLLLVRVFSLHAGQLRNLRITNHTRLSDIGTCEIHLTCSVENSNDSLLRWHVVGNTSIKEANLTISWDPRNSSDQKYTCIAENPVSNIAFSVSTQSLCKGNSLSQVPLRALSSCGLWCVPPAQGDSPKQWPSGRQPNPARRGQTFLQLCASHYLQRPLHPPSLPRPFLQPTKSPGAKFLGSQNCSPLWLYRAPALSVTRTPTLRKSTQNQSLASPQRRPRRGSGEALRKTLPVTQMQLLFSFFRCFEYEKSP